MFYFKDTNQEVYAYDTMEDFKKYGNPSWELMDKTEVERHTSINKVGIQRNRRSKKSNKG